MKSRSTELRTLPHVRDSLQAQLGDIASMARVHRAAEAAARVPRDSLIARELVGDVVGETFDGTLLWDPEQVSLATHLVTEVRRRADRHRCQQAIFVSLETLRESETPHVGDPYPGGDARRSEVELPALPRLRNMLRMRAADDGHVLQLLAICEQGKLRRRDALRLGMSTTEYRRARRRLKRLTSEVLAATPETPAEHPVGRSAAKGAPATPPENQVCQSAELTSAIGLLLAATRFGPRRAAASAPAPIESVAVGNAHGARRTPR